MTRRVLIVNAEAAFYRDALAPQFPDFDFATAANSAEALPLAGEAEVLVGLAGQLSGALLAAAPGLRWVQALTSGTEAITGRPELPPGALVTSAAGTHGPQMSEMAFLLMLNHARGMGQLAEDQRNRRWERRTPGLLFRSTVAIIGMGAIATALAARCKAFGMRVVGVTRATRAVPDFDTVYSREDTKEAVSDADFVVVLLPLDETSARFVGADFLAAMKPSAYFINLARGGIVDEPALLEALKAKRIAGAGLDVFTTEPLPADSAFWGLPNVVVTPHVGGQSAIYHEQVLPILAENFRHYAAGNFDRLINVVRRPG